MKKLIFTLCSVALTLGLSLNAQDGKSKPKTKTDQEVGQTDNVTPDTKASYIKNQDYLSVNTLKDYRSFYGDSLKGFDEAAVKADLLTKGVFGSEYTSYIKVVKRRYINQKFGIGPKIDVQQQANPTVITTQTLPVSGKNIGGGNVINIAPCVNEDFEATLPGQYTTANAVTGWTVQQMTTNGCATGPLSSGSSEFWIVSTPLIGFPTIGTIPNSPLGGTRVAKLNDYSPSTHVTKLSTTFPVTSANSLFQFAFAGYYENGGHGCCDQPGFFVRVLNCSNQVLTCSSLTLAAGCAAINANFTTTAQGNSWCNWQVKYIDLTPYIGTCVTFECWNNDCSFGGHYGCTLFDARCGGQLIGSGLSGVGGNIPGPVSFCAGSGLAQISAPLGYASYTWVAPPGSPTIAPSQATLSTITITNPVVNAVYTVNLTSPSGCAFTATNAITQSTLQIVGIGTTTSCINGSSGSATVQGNGSPTGYTYTWTNSSNSVVSSASVASGLLPGMYTVTVGGSGAFCGPPVSTTAQIVTGPQSLISLLKPFCNGQAYLNTAGGSNFQWYNGTSAISSTLGGTASGYTVNTPFQGAVYYLSYLSSYGCQDSIQFTLVQSPPGLLNVSNVSLICPGGTNGTAVISMTPATGSPPGINSFSVVNSNSTTPAFNASLYPTPLTDYTVTGLAAGSYTVKTFDGSCSYTTAFNVFANVFNFSLTPNNATLCPGNQMAVGASFSVPVSPGQYTFSWTPSTWLAGGNPNLQNTIVSPTIPIGTSSTVIYTVVATPTLINCPLSKTMAVTMVSPPTPTISPILPSCDNQAPFPVLVSPTGGTFYCAGPTPTSPITALGGIITPSLAGLGTKTLTYTIKQNTCTASQTATFEVSHYNPAIITSSISPLCVTNNPVNLMNIVQFTNNGVWSGPGVAGTSFVPGNVQGGIYTLTFATTSTPNLATCPATAAISVPVTNTISPNIVQIPPFCTNAAPFNMTVTPSGGIWSNPAINALTGSVNPANAVPSNSIATYTVVNGPCVNVKTTTLIISNYNPATLSTSNIALCAFGTPMNLMSIVSGTSNGSWAGQSVISNSFNPFQLATGTYTALYTRVSTPISGLCDYTAAVNISVLNPPVPTINQVGPFCSKDAAIQLVVSPSTGTWTGASYLNTSGVFVPSLAAVGNNAVQYVIGTSTCNSQQTKFISVEGFASAALTGKIADQCNTSTPINLLPITQSNQGIWSGPGISGTSFNPGTAGAGHFVLTYNTASSPSGLCPDQSTVAVTVYSLAAPAITKIKRLCNNAEPVQLQVSPVGGLFGGANNFAVSSKGLFNPAIGVIGDNIINYSITSGPCVAYGQTTVTIEKFVSAGFTGFPKAVYCQTIDQPINLNSFATNPGGTWTGAGVSPGSSMFDPNMVAVGTNSVFYKTHSMPTPSLCPDENVLTLKVGTITPIAPRTAPSTGCVPYETILNVPGVDDGTAMWVFGDGSDPKQELTTSHVYTAPGHYTATLAYVNRMGCPSPPVTVATFTVHELPAPDFSAPEEVFISDPVVQFTNLTPSINSNKYTWKIEGIANSNEVNPNVPFPKIGRYNVTLLAENPNTTCKAEITKPLDVKNDFNVFIPSSFSPNFDGINDIFIPVFTAYGLDSKTYEFEVFDRWGHSIFRTKDVTKGWDGTVNNKGEAMKEEVYVYKIKYKDLDGNLYNKIGHVSLLK